MFDTEMREYSRDESVDALVIGTGSGGAPLLARLAGAGLSVVALEAGQKWNPARDFATDEKAQDKLFWTDERLSAGNDPLHFGNNNSGIGVGGSTLHYTAYTPRVQPDDLRLFSDFGVARDWPLSYADLEPYYDELETFLGVSGPNPYPWGRRALVLIRSRRFRSTAPRSSWSAPARPWVFAPRPPPMPRCRRPIFAKASAGERPAPIAAFVRRAARRAPRLRWT